MSDAARELHSMCLRVAGDPQYLDELVFISSQSGGSHLGAFFKLQNGNKYYVKFPALPSHYNDDEGSQMKFAMLLSGPTEFFAADAAQGSGKQSSRVSMQAKAEVLVSKLYAMVGVAAATMRFVTIKGHEHDGPVGLWSRNQSYEDIPPEQMQLPGLKEGFAADAWLANWDVIGNGSPAERNMKRDPNGRAFRVDFGGCLQYRASGGDKSECGVPFGPDVVPEIDSLRQHNRLPFGDINDEDIRGGVAKIAALPDEAIRDVVLETMGQDVGTETANILIGRKNWLIKSYPPS